MLGLLITGLATVVAGGIAAIAAERRGNKPARAAGRVIMVVGVAVAVAGGALHLSGWRPEPAALSPVQQALADCKWMIGRQMGLSDAVTIERGIPDARNHGSGGEFYFAWGKGSVATFPVGPYEFSASCTGFYNPTRIETATLNGKTVK